MRMRVNASSQGIHRVIRFCELTNILVVAATTCPAWFAKCIYALSPVERQQVADYADFIAKRRA